MKMTFMKYNQVLDNLKAQYYFFLWGFENSMYNLIISVAPKINTLSKYDSDHTTLVVTATLGKFEISILKEKQSIDMPFK